MSSRKLELGGISRVSRAALKLRPTTPDQKRYLQATDILDSHSADFQERPNAVVVPQRLDVLLACPEDSNGVLNGHHHSIAPSSTRALGRRAHILVNT